MASNSKSILAGIFLCLFLFVGSGWSADFDITIVSGGETPTITIQNNTDFAAYVYDLVKTDGTHIAINQDVIRSATIQVNADLFGVTEARCIAAEGAFEGWEKYLHNPESKDGFFHYTATVFN